MPASGFPRLCPIYLKEQLKTDIYVGCVRLCGVHVTLTDVNTKWEEVDSLRNEETESASSVVRDKNPFSV